jgi:hypothetical protein
MTGSDLLVLAPWIVFIAGLAVICVLLLRSRSGSRLRRPPRSAPGAPAGREPANCQDPQEARCRENNAQPRPQ